MRVYLESLGCRLNQSELEDLARRFAAAGHTPVGERGQADVCVVNTCVVTAKAERTSRHLLRSLHRANPDARIAVVGCYASLDPAELTRLPGVAWTVPNVDKSRTVEIVAGTPAPSTFPRSPSWERLGGFQLHTRAFVKVQDGCNNRCTYCVTCLVRGSARSRPLDEVIAEVQGLAEGGYQEVVLTGVNLGSYGCDLGIGQGLRGLVEKILSDTDLPRLRLSSLEPWKVDGALLELWADSRLCRQFHLPLQSGCDETLRRMGRRISVDQYARLVEAVRDAIPDVAITSDVMVGFPGEDESAFAESLAFTEEMAFSRLHVFPFSPRPGTEAAQMSQQVPLRERRERSRRARRLGARLAERFCRRFVGQQMEVLWERRRPDGLWHGLTDNYLRVVTSHPGELHNLVTQTQLLALRDGVLVGRVEAEIEGGRSARTCVARSLPGSRR
ncbi:MAG: tRNA (N(6)-L-threonylcarbamoyladenosine(37)-C(2))-methylthiotransferase MtaB [Anaerolineae bacterium]|jgi:threonylcarbamoyladenosine tRNA methylthiotransferase MtaB